MSKDLVKNLTVNKLVAMGKIVDNWVNDDNFTSTSESKKIAISFQQILYGLSSGDPKAAVEGVTLLDSLIRDNFNLKKQ